MQAHLETDVLLTWKSTFPFPEKQGLQWSQINLVPVPVVTLLSLPELLFYKAPATWG